MPALDIAPTKVILGSLQSQRFEATVASAPVASVTWAISPPGQGSIDSAGVYTSPRWIFVTRTVTVTATSSSDIGTATVELTSLATWTRFLGAYWIVSGAALMIALLCLWRSLCPTCDPVDVVVSPPVVTLLPSQQQQFTANTPVTWGPGLDAIGIYSAPKTAEGVEKLTMTATSSSDPRRSGSAIVYVAKDVGLSLYPASSGLKTGETKEITAVSTPAGTQVEWLQPVIGKIQASGPHGQIATFDTTGGSVDRPTRVLILARTTGETPRLAGAYVLVAPPNRGSDAQECTTNTASLLGLIFLMGAIGGLIHGISSFSIFVGNRQLLTSWVWWYVFKPVIGGFVALVVYLVFRGGFGGNSSLASADCVGVAALAGLMGLFAEPATLKLREIFDTLFTTRQDPRNDPLRGAGKRAPSLMSLSPSSVKVGQSPPPPIMVTGTGFVDKCRAAVDTQLRATRFVSDGSVELKLEAADVTGTKDLSVVVYNDPPTGAASNALTLKVIP